MQGIITKITPKQFDVLVKEQIFTCTAKGKIKLEAKLKLGDMVEIEDECIVEVKKRYNNLIRPDVANIGNLVIVISKTPEPDYNLVDLMLCICLKEKIHPIICVNKTDLDEDNLIFNEVKSAYQKHFEVVFISAKNKTNLQSLKKQLTNITAFAGQSGAGKSSIINSLYNINLKTGQLSDKIVRGKNTTTQSYFHVAGENIIIDTPGFSFLDVKLLGITPEDFKAGFLEYKQLGCKYSSCNHINEADCAVKKLVENDKLNKNRYIRYRENFVKIQNIYNKRYS